MKKGPNTARVIKLQNQFKLNSFTSNEEIFNIISRSQKLNKDSKEEDFKQNYIDIKKLVLKIVLLDSDVDINIFKDVL